MVARGLGQAARLPRAPVRDGRRRGALPWFAVTRHTECRPGARARPPRADRGAARRGRHHAAGACARGRHRRPGRRRFSSTHYASSSLTAAGAGRGSGTPPPLWPWPWRAGASGAARGLLLYAITLAAAIVVAPFLGHGAGSLLARRAPRTASGRHRCVARYGRRARAREWTRAIRRTQRDALWLRSLAASRPGRWRAPLPPACRASCSRGCTSVVSPRSSRRPTAGCSSPNSRWSRPSVAAASSTGSASAARTAPRASVIQAEAVFAMLAIAVTAWLTETEHPASD